jgi:hypothetical protein
MIADRPRGSREFYWDTVFIPEDDSGSGKGLTYAEIVESKDLGLADKMRQLSLSSPAMKGFLEYRLRTGDPELWRRPVGASLRRRGAGRRILPGLARGATGAPGLAVPRQLPTVGFSAFWEEFPLARRALSLVVTRRL